MSERIHCNKNRQVTMKSCPFGEIVQDTRLLIDDKCIEMKKNTGIKLCMSEFI